MKMRHTEREMLALREEVNEMWNLVISQLEKAKQSFLNNEIETALEIASREKRVDAFELKIDADCENYIALYSPVAIDLRLVLSLKKISNTLERIGDFAAGIARHVIDDDCYKVETSLIQDLQLEKMFDLVLRMLQDNFTALESESTNLAGKILAIDESVDAIYENSFNVLSEYLKSHPLDASCCFRLLLLVRKLERIGDHCNNIVEEIVFYVDAKVLKHSINKKEDLI